MPIYEVISFVAIVWSVLLTVLLFLRTSQRNRALADVEWLEKECGKRFEDWRTAHTDFINMRVALRSFATSVFVQASNGLGRTTPPIQALFWICRGALKHDIVVSQRARRRVSELLDRLVIDGVVEDEDHTYGSRS